MNQHIKKSFYMILSVIFIFATLPHSADIYATSFTGIDNQSGIAYSVEQYGINVIITYDNINTTLTVDDRILNTICIDNTVTLLCSTNDFFYSVYTYNTQNKKLDYFVTELKADFQAPVFSVNKSGCICLLNKDDKRIIHIIQNSTVSSVSLPSTVYQIMNTEYEDFLVFTADGVHSLKDTHTEYISDIVLATPCTYSLQGLIEDALGKLYTYSGKDFLPYIRETTDTASDTPSSIITDENYIYLEFGTTFAKLYKALHIDKSQLTVTKPDGKIITSGKLGTGMTAELSGKTYDIVITGDLTGEGNINSRDLKALMKHLSKEAPLKNAFLKAADIYSDSEINTKDILKLSNMY